MSRRLDDRGAGPALPDWRLLAIGGLLLAGLIVIGLVLLFGSGPSESVGTVQANDGQTHVTAGIDCRAPANASQEQECGGRDPYSSVPAASGPHWPPDAVANWGVYSTPQPETQLIHNLEHGGIVIWYRDDLPQEQVDELASYVEAQVSQGVAGRFKFILSPWGGSAEIGAPIVVTAWRYLLELDELDTAAIDEFAREHYGQSPEPNGGPGPPS
jgi:hypothetical protein